MKLSKCISRHMALALVPICLCLFTVGEAYAAGEPCRVKAKEANEEAQNYRAAARSVGQSCTREGSDCTSAKSQASNELQELSIAHEAMLRECNAGGPPPPPPPVPSPTLPGDLLITEIMPRPSCPEGEWFEVYNPTTSPFELQGITVRNRRFEMFTIPISLVVPAGGFVVFARDHGSTCVGAPLLYAYPNFFLDDGVDIIEILNGTVSIDRVQYDDFTPGGPPILEGRSLNLDPDSFSASANDAEANWCLSIGGVGSFGTGSPGVANHQCP